MNNSENHESFLLREEELKTHIKHIEERINKGKALITSYRMEQGTDNPRFIDYMKKLRNELRQAFEQLILIQEQHTTSPVPSRIGPLLNENSERVAPERAFFSLEINQIDRLGRFSSQMDCSRFKFKTPLVFVKGTNGSGKTTLAAIFRSLSQNDPAPLLERQTLGVKNHPSIKLTLDGLEYSFSNAQWSQSCNKISVFDSTFINTHIHSGFVISTEHRRNLFQLVLGSQTVNTSQEIVDLDTRSRELAKEMSHYDERHYLQGHFTMEQFIGLSPPPDWEKRYHQILNRLAAIESSESFQDGPILQTLAFPFFPIEEVNRVISTQFKNIQSDAEEKLEHWISGLGKGGRHWVSEGMTHLQNLNDENCPFCSQSLDQNELIKAYQTCFNQAYQFQQEQLKSLNHELAHLLPEDLLFHWQNILKSNQQSILYWNRYLGLLNQPDIDFNQIWSELKAVQTSLFKAVQTRQGDLIQDLVIPLEMNHTLENMAQTFKEYNQIVSQQNMKIHEQIKKIQHEDPLNLKQELAMLEMNQKRQDPLIHEDINNYQNLKNKKTKLLKQKDILKKRLNQENRDLFKQYSVRINKYLQKFGLDLRLELQNVFLGGKPNLDYTLCLSKKSFKLNNPKKSIPSYRTVLSEGDKQALGLAFFLAQQEDWPRRLVVFDDPGVALDANRIGVLQDCVRNLLKAGVQVIILTHQENWSSFADSETIELE